MNVAIFDLQHYEMVHTLHHIYDSASNNISFFTNKNILSKIKKSDLRNSSFNVILSDDFNTIEDYFHSCLIHIKEGKIDLIIFNTIDKNYKEIWSFINKIKIPIIVTIHNVCTWLNPPFTLNRVALSNYYNRFRIKQKTKAIIVLEESQKEFILSNKLYKKPIIVIPYSINDTNRTIIHKKNEILKVAIPGGIDGHRRNIDLVLEIAEEIYNSNLKIEFYFIGNVLGELGRALLKKMELLKEKGCLVSHYYSDEDNSLFEKKMTECDIILSPINVKTNYEGIQEIYGQTKATGVVFDLMRFEKPGILPIDLKTSSNMNSSIIKYESKKNLIDILSRLIKDSAYLQDLTYKATKNAVYYNKDNLKARILTEIESKISY